MGVLFDNLGMRDFEDYFEYKMLTRNNNCIKLLVAYKISQFLKAKNIFYICRGSINNSYFAAKLGITDVYDIPLCEIVDDIELNFILEKKDSQILVNHLNKVFYSKKLYRLSNFIKNKNTIKSNTYLFLLDDLLNFEIKRTKNKEGKNVEYFTDEFYFNHKNDFISVNIYSNDTMLLMKKCRIHFNDSSYYSLKIDYLNELIQNNIAFVFCNELDNFTKEISKDLFTFNDYVEYLIRNKSYKYYKWRRGDVIKEVQNLCLLSEYFFLDPDFFIKHFSFRFVINDIVDLSKCSSNELKVQKTLLEFYQTKIKDRYVGPFFNISGQIFAHKELVNIFNLDDRFINSDLSHMDFFDEFKKPNMKEEYSMYPRGRVLYDTERCLFKVFLDKSILKDNLLLMQIKSIYNLGKLNVSFEVDEHYQVLNY